MQNNHKRTIAIFHDKNEMDKNVDSLLALFTERHNVDKIYVFTSSGCKFNTIKNGMSIENVNWTSDCNTIPKLKNFINAYLKSLLTDGFVHVISDNISLLKDPILFIDELEHMMKALDYTLWMNTVTDVCNYLYSKYTPRLVVGLDRDEYKMGFGDSIVYTSHSNDNWVCYDFDAIDDRLLKFDEDFSIAMFYIIELLARRKALKKEHQLFFMNLYMTVTSEKDAFTILDVEDNCQNKQNMKLEDLLFKSKNINYAPDNNIDEVLEKTLEAFRSKNVKYQS